MFHQAVIVNRGEVGSIGVASRGLRSNATILIVVLGTILMFLISVSLNTCVCLEILSCTRQKRGDNEERINKTRRM